MNHRLPAHQEPARREVLLGRFKLESTVSIEVDDGLEISEEADI